MAPKKVFLSYNSLDRDEVSNIYNVLKDHGFNPWMDESDLESGSRFQRELERHIETSDVFLCLIGNHNQGKWQVKEWDYAIHRKEAGRSPKHAIPIILLSVQGNPRIDGFLNLYNCVDLRANPYKFADILINAINRLTPESELSTPASVEIAKSQPLTSYLENLWRQCIELNTTNFEYAVRQQAGRLSLSAVYTSLDVIEAQEHQRVYECDKPTDSESHQGISVMQSILEHPFLVLTGDPGSGKSTIVDFLTVCLVGQFLGKKEANIALFDVIDFPPMVPIRIILRHFAPHGLAKDRDLWTYIIEHCARLPMGNSEFQDCRSELEQALNKSDGCLLLLDGIDEVPDSSGWRQRLKKRIEEFRLRFPLARILVTSRPYAYQTREERFNGFEERRVAPFNLPQMQEFVHKWYGELGIKQARLGSDTAAKYAERLKAALESNPRLAELGQNPLLMSLMGWLHRVGEGGALPEKRQKLYEFCVEHLIDVWQRDKPLFDDFGEPRGTQFDIRQELGISKAALRQALEKLAYNAHHDQPELVDAHDIPVEDLVVALLEVTKADGLEPDTDKIKKFITNRAGILIETDQERIYRFPHRTFQEYLAACHLSNNQFPHRLRELVREDDERWREALLLSASYVEIGSSIWQLVEVFCNYLWPVQPQNPEWYLVLRAAQAVIETGKHENVDQYQKQIFEILKTRLVALLETQYALSDKPRDRAEVGRALSILGDIRQGIVEMVESDGISVPSHAWVPVQGTLNVGLVEGFKLGQGTKRDPLAKEGEVWPSCGPGIEIQPFYMSAYPVTCAQFTCFVNAGGEGYLNDQFWTEAGLKDRGDNKFPSLWNNPDWHIANHPVVGVTWYEAVAYCNWLTDCFGKFLGERKWVVRLPSEAEWEWAARGPEARFWPWGDEWNNGACNSNERSLDRTIATGSDPTNRNWLEESTPSELPVIPDALCQNRNVTAVFDLVGNVWEWCSTKWAESYTIDTVTGNHWSQDYLEGEDLRALRGGGYWNDKPQVRSGARGGGDPGGGGSDGGGFRCCLSVSSGLY